MRAPSLNASPGPHFQPCRKATSRHRAHSPVAHAMSLFDRRVSICVYLREPNIARPGTPLYLSSLSVLNSTCTQNSLLSSSNHVQKRPSRRSTSRACSLKPHVSYGSAATSKYWKFLSGSSCFCSYADMNLTRGCTPCEISGYCSWNRRPFCLVNGSRTLVILYPGLPILTMFLRGAGRFRPSMASLALPSFCSRAARRARFVWCLRP